MGARVSQERKTTRTFLGALRADARGNTLAMMAIALIPISGLAGSAVDVARLYVVKVRLQQACDAGVLAGRKFMIDSDSTTLDTTAVTRANAFFTNNFRSGWMNTTSPTFTPTKTADKQVAGVASVTVPMSIMKMFAVPDATLNVTCEARYDVADTDIMFVLDTTGSMACKPERDESDCASYTSGKSYTYTRPSSTDAVAGYAGTTGYAVTEETSGTGNISRIQALRVAVPEFYATVAANVDASTNVRYGFVTYSSMVNAGKAIVDKSASYMIGGSGSTQQTWTYQSRQVSGDYVVSTGTATYNSKTQTNCPTSYGTRSPETGYVSNGTAARTVEKWYAGTIKKCGTATETLGPKWTYRPVTYNVANFVAGNTVTDPSRVDSATAKWLGCIEERDTTAGATTFNNNSLPADLDPVLIPSSQSSQWRPYWPEVVYERAKWDVYPTTDGDNASNESYVDPDRLAAGKNGCAKPVQRLKKMTATEVSNFVTATDFKPVGGTYHDVGMIWGLRLMAPGGVFATDTAPWPGRPAPNRVIVFFTDGDMAPSDDAYSLYGVEMLDRRVTGGNTTDKKVYHNARFLAACTKAKSLGIDVWTIAIAPSATTELQSCATSTAQALFTTTGTGLSDAFKKIAKQVAMLRVSK